MGKGFKSIKYIFEDRNNFISFVDTFSVLIDNLKYEIEDELSEDDVIEIYTINNERIINQTQYEIYYKDDSLTELKIIVKKINKFEQEKLENERLEKERIEQERLEKERIEQERIEKERLEKERIEKERLEKERIEKERKEKERLKLLEKERLEIEKLERKAKENTIIIRDELIKKVSTLLDNKISNYCQQLNEYKEQSNSMLQNLDNKINEFQTIIQSKNRDLNLRIKNISNIVNELKQNQQILYDKSNNTELIESSLNNLKLNHTNNNLIKNQFNNLSNNIQQIISKPLDDFINNNKRQINNSSNLILNKNSEIQSEFNTIQTKINELKHYKKENNPTFFNTSANNNNSYNSSDEPSFFPNNEIEFRVLNEKNVFKSFNILNGTASIKVEYKSKKDLPINCKIAPLGRSQKDIYIDEFIITEEIPKNINKIATLKLKCVKGKNLSGKYDIGFGLYKPTNGLVQKYNYEIEIEK